MKWADQAESALPLCESADMSAEALAKEEWRQGLIVERGRPWVEEDLASYGAAL